MALDATTFITHAIDEVIFTLVAAVVLVFIVMLVFLQSFRATLIPTLVVPVALMGAFIGMEIFGFSINQLTLFGMVLAIGIVVDDAIVVIESVERLMREEHLSPRDATRKAMDQITSPIIAISLVLAAVFIPAAMQTGSVGVIYQQFALTIAISMLFSAFLALSLTPALCATLLRPEHLKENRFFRLVQSRLRLVAVALPDHRALQPAPQGLVAGRVRRAGGDRRHPVLARAGKFRARRRPGLRHRHRADAAGMRPCSARARSCDAWARRSGSRRRWTRYSKSPDSASAAATRARASSSSA